MQQNIARFLDGEGRLTQMPAKRAVRSQVLAYMAEKFEYGVEYLEHEVNEIIAKWHTFGDYFIIRRELVEEGWLKRLPNGSKYWKDEEKRPDVGEE